MRRGLYLSLFALFLLLLSGCGEASTPETRILVSIREAPGFFVQNNGQYIPPGGDAVFLLNMNHGFSLADTDYSGEYQTDMSGGQIRLTSAIYEAIVLIIAVALL